MSSNSDCNHIHDWQIGLPHGLSDFVNHLNDYRLNWTPLSPKVLPSFYFIYWIWWESQMFHLPFPKPISSTEHISLSFSVSSSSFKLFAGFCLKYIFWLPGQIFAASLRITAILLKCETYSNNLAFLNIFWPSYTGFPSYCKRLACLEYEHNYFPKHLYRVK